MPEGGAAALEKQYTQRFGAGIDVSAANVVDVKQFEVRTPNVVIKVDPAHSDLVETRVINGARYILIRAEEGVEVNGVSISHSAVRRKKIAVCLYKTSPLICVEAGRFYLDLQLSIGLFAAGGDIAVHRRRAPDIRCRLLFLPRRNHAVAFDAHHLARVQIGHNDDALADEHFGIFVPLARYR
ncbi:MAG: DUF4317 family protein [Christensenellales bacterium]